MTLNKFSMKNPLHPELPEEYENILDYRKISRKYLCKNIPQGGGMIKWTSFATTPELYKNIEQHINEQNKIKKPELSDEQILEINIRLSMMMNKPSSCAVRCYEDGYINQHECIIEYVDTINKTVRCYLCYMQERKVFSLFDIVEII